MAESSVHVLLNKSSNAEVVTKAVKILAAIDNCGCEHCLKLAQEALQSKGLGPETLVPSQHTAIGVTNSNDSRNIR